MRKFNLSLALLLSSNAVLLADTYKIDEVNVSANKIEESILNVAQSITVLSEVDLEERGIKTVDELINEIPNMTSYPYFYQSVNFRGINESIIIKNNPVTIYVDGIPYSNSMGYVAALTDVEQVEILRGPQGSLYGKDSMGAIINIISKKPNNKWGGRANLEYGTNNHIYGALNLNGAIIDDIFFVGANGDYMRDDGHMRNLYSGKKGLDKKEYHNFGLNFTLTPTDRFSARLNLSSYRDNFGYMNAVAVNVNEDINSYKAKDTKYQDLDFEPFSKIKTDAQALNLKYEFDNFDLSSTTTHKKSKANVEYDFDKRHNGLHTFYKYESDILNEELKISSRNSEGFRWVAGMYYEKERIKYPRYGNKIDMTALGMGMIDMSVAAKGNANTAALFGQATAPIFSNLELTVGARIQTISKDAVSDFYRQAVGLAPQSTPSLFHFDEKNRWRSVLPKASLNYKINEGATTYLSVTTGYLPGGFSPFIMMGDKDSNMVKPQRSINYEIGAKGYLLENRLYFSTTLFYMDIKDIHVATFANGVAMATNAGAAHSYGMEIDLLYKPINSLEINGALGVIKTKYDTYDVRDFTGSLVPAKGKKIQKTPPYTAKFGIQYNNPMGFYARVDARAQGATYYDPENTLKGNAYILGDVKAGYRTKGGFDVYAYINNLTNKSYITNAQAKTVSPNRDTLVLFGEGRKIGLGVRYTY